MIAAISQPRGIPTYRRHQSFGQAVVTVADSTEQRREVLLGKYGTAHSHKEYARVIAEREAGDCLRSCRRRVIPYVSCLFCLTDNVCAPR
jgi:hypothetical protein